MMINKKNIKIFLTFVAIVLIGLIVFTSLRPVIERFELRTLDLRLLLAANKEEPSSEIVQLLVDDESIKIAQSDETVELGRIPWPRKAWGEMLEYLNRAGAKAVVFDINFLGPEGFTEANKESDQYFVDAVKKSKAKTFFAVLFRQPLYTLRGNSQEIQKEIANRLNSISPEFRELLKKKSIAVKEELPDKSITRFFITYTEFNKILKGLLKYSDGIGAIALSPDIDGVNRKNMPLYKYNGEYYPSLSLGVALSQLPKEERQIILKEGLLLLGDRKIPLDIQGRNFISWYGGPGTYPHYSAVKAIISERALKKGEKPILDPKLFKDKIVILGQSASGTDLHQVPMASGYAGTEFVSTNINNYLYQKNFIDRLDHGKNFLLALVFCLLIYVSVTKSKSIPTSIVLALSIIVLYIFLSILALIYLKTWVELVYPVLMLSFTFIGAYIIKYVFTHKQLESAIEEATKDGLTKLHNHRFFQEKIHRDISNAQRAGDKVALCLIDIDFFKKFNDTYGHRAGDAVLIQVAQGLKDNVRKGDLVARYGGEEMCVLLDKTPTQEALIVAEKLVRAIEKKPFYINDGKDIVHVTISVGVATFPDHASSVPDLIEFADKGLYRAKEGGRNQVGALEDTFVELDASNPKQIKEVEIAKAKLLKGLEDFIKISQEHDYEYEPYLFEVIKEKEIFSDSFLDNVVTETEEENPE